MPDYWTSLLVTWGCNGYWMKLPDITPPDAKVTLKAHPTAGGDPLDSYDFLAKHNPPAYCVIPMDEYLDLKSRAINA